MFNVVIIGAGINGAGIARDAALRGLRVLLLDKGDVGGGTSAWSTRLIHGGLRYLEHGEFGLVRESLRERETLLKIAPHLVKPLPMLVPTYNHARRSRTKIRLGMLAYDALSYDKTLPRHSMLSTKETLARVPALEKDGLTGAALYYDAQVEFPERLVVENVLSAIENGAELMTYARVDGFEIHHDAIDAVRFTNLLTGTSGIAQGMTFANAAGPWVDHLLEAAPDSSQLIGGTKGSHIIVARFAGAPESAIYVEASTDQRPFFIIPWNNKYLIGTTDIRFSGNPDDARITEAEVAYLLQETNRVLPSAELTRHDVLFSYAGVRPLAFTKNEREARITRRHFIRSHPHLNNLFSIVGGKLTTYRSLSEETVDAVVKLLGTQVGPCKTAEKLLPGAAPLDQTSVVHEDERLSRVYGLGAKWIGRLCEGDASLWEVFDGETGAIAAEIVHAFRHEHAQTLIDCLMRRTMVGLNSTNGLSSVEKAAEIASLHLGWTEERAAAEVVSYRKYVERFRLPRPEGPPVSSHDR